MNDTINGYSAEAIFSQAICQEKRIHKERKITSQVLLKEIKNSPYLGDRASHAFPYLKQEWGIPTFTGDGRRRLSFHWADIPKTVLLDYIYGVDFFINLLGYRIAIDITVNPEKTENKRMQLRTMFHHSNLFDNAIVLLLNTNQPRQLFRHSPAPKQWRSNAVPVGWAWD